MKLLKTYIRLVDRLSHTVGRLVSVLMPAMVVVLAFEVVARYVFKRPTIWVYDLAIFMFGYIGLLAGAYVLKNRQHVNVDILYDRFSPRQKAISDSLTGLLFFFLVVKPMVRWSGRELREAMVETQKIEAPGGEALEELEDLRRKGGPREKAALLAEKEPDLSIDVIRAWLHENANA